MSFKVIHAQAHVYLCLSFNNSWWWKLSQHILQTLSRLVLGRSFCFIFTLALIYGNSKPLDSLNNRIGSGQPLASHSSCSLIELLLEVSSCVYESHDSSSQFPSHHLTEGEGWYRPLKSHISITDGPGSLGTVQHHQVLRRQEGEVRFDLKNLKDGLGYHSICGGLSYNKAQGLNCLNQRQRLNL